MSDEEFNALIAGLDDIPVDIEDPWSFVDRFRASCHAFATDFDEKDWASVQVSADQLATGMEILQVEAQGDAIRTVMAVLEAISHIISSEAMQCPEGKHILSHVLPVLASYGLLMDTLARRLGVRPYAESPGA